ncbi:MAG: hypothetical protein QM773_03165 [Hyphomonadaceae bacterium]
MSTLRKQANTAPKILGTRALAAINAVEGLKLGAASKKRLQALQNDPTLTPDQLRAEVLKAYAALSRCNVEHADTADEMFSKLMGDIVEPRREFIQENALEAEVDA